MLVPGELNIESDESIVGAAVEIKAQHGKVDVVIKNAGAQFEQREIVGKMSEREMRVEQQQIAGNMSAREMWNRSWNVNTAGTQIPTATIAPLLRQSIHPSPALHHIQRAELGRNEGPKPRDDPRRRLPERQDGAQHADA
ncbi:uncharacterized protein BDW47DRAFT_128203 [Aspergillus candidus]|uniref:Ketoreductase (KR) domain-containing protein n=1 Tax=Aspergillus candidus TaxID=41067 RepID=A0A2I2F442_ASPCN|nr:hypothetical protein BDW47DRAFT_128203 [Aspergillus candidus]PLB35412.1 hypothetical protein BDW47DRAFT_128203 [Aspergillus candidus]